MLVSVLSRRLEDPLFPPLLFAVLGVGWVLTQDASHNGQRRPGQSPLMADRS